MQLPLLLSLVFATLSSARAELVVIPRTVSPSHRFAFAKQAREDSVEARLVHLPKKTPIGTPFFTDAVRYALAWKGTDRYLSSVWNPQETRVAVNCLNARGGEIEVFRRTKAGVKILRMPDLEKIAMRNTPGAYEQTQLFPEAKRWVHGNILEVAIDGTMLVAEHGDNKPWGTLGYAFLLQISFDGHGKGRATNLKRIKLPDEPT